jgi:hypothetical protein
MQTIKICLVIITAIVCGAAIWGINDHVQAARKAHEAELDERRHTLNTRSREEYQSWADAAVESMLVTRRSHPAKATLMQSEQSGLDEETNREIHRALAGLSSATKDLWLGTDDDVQKCDEGGKCIERIRKLFDAVATATCPFRWL